MEQVRRQMESLMEEKAKLAQENAKLLRKNRRLDELVRLHAEEVPESDSPGSAGKGESHGGPSSSPES